MSVVILDGNGSVWKAPYSDVFQTSGWQPWTNVGGVLQDVSPAGVGSELYFLGQAPSGDLWWWKQTGSQWTWIGNRGVANGKIATTPR
jgi:hypothetical protein